MTRHNYGKTAGLLIALMALMLIGGASARAATPDWQPANSVQNIYENHLLWGETTGELDDEAVEDIENAHDYIGQALSISLSYVIHMDETYPKGSCARQFWLMSSSIVHDYTDVYAGMYLNSTALVGDPADVEALFAEALRNEEWQINDAPDKCWAKLDT